MKIAGLMPIGRDADETFLIHALKSLRPLTDVVIALCDNACKPINSLVDEVIFVKHEKQWHDASNRLTLFARAIAHDCDWCMRLDSDELPEPEISKEIIRNQIREAQCCGAEMISWRMREMWNEKEFRVDGVWGQKRKIILQKNPLLSEAVMWRGNHTQRLHVQPLTCGDIMDVETQMLHYGMSSPALRQSRYEKHVALDPRNLFQPQGYKYFLDEEGIELKAI